MTISVSTRFNAAGSASAIAIAAAFIAAAPAHAAPPPVQAVPTPAAPAAPGNVEQCAFDPNAPNVVFVCKPGRDPDGAALPHNSLPIVIDAGSQVQGEISALVNVTLTNNGSVVAGGGTNAIDLGAASTVINNGYLTASPFFDGIIRAGNESTVTNNGIITQNGGGIVAGILSPGGLTITNNGLIAMRGSGNAGIVTNLNGLNAPVTITNSATGQIIVDSLNGASGYGIIDFGPNTTVVNNGLIQTFGNTSDAILLTGNNATVTNSGFIVTTGNNSEAISAGNNATVFNTASGSIFTGGNSLLSILVGTNSTVMNNGIISTQGSIAYGIAAGAGSTVLNWPAGQIGTIGAASHGVYINGAGRLENIGGLIQTTGAGANAVNIQGNATVFNSGRLVSTNGRAVDLAGVSTVNNVAGGIIAGTNGDALRFNTAGSTLTNAGEISAAGAGALGVNAQVANTTITNTGKILTSGTNSAAVYVGGTSTVTNSGTIATTADNTVGVALGNGSTLTNAVGGTISTIGVNGNAVVFTGGGTLTNAGTISTLRPNSTAVTAIGNLNITNTGAITSTTGRGVDIGSGNIVNGVGGSISGGTDAIRTSGASTILNQGAISGANGIVANAGSQTVFNFGSITGTTSAASLGAGDDALVNINGGSVTGNADGGTGNDVFAYIITDTTSRVFNLDEIGAKYQNFESLRFGSQTFDYVNLTANGAPTATGRVSLVGTTSQAITVINAGTLAGTVNNTVTLLQGANAGIAPVFTVAAGGKINAFAGDAIDFTGTGWTINNSGLIQSNTGFGIDSNGAANTTVINNATGRIATYVNSVASVYAGANSLVQNFGDILTQGNNTVSVVAGNQSGVANATTGRITSLGSNAHGVVITGSGTLTNAGLIQTGGAGSNGVIITGGSVFVNSGRIISANGRAVDLGGVSTATNSAGGLISGTNGDAIRFNTAGSTLTNAGTITAAGAGALGVNAQVANMTVNNTGTISTSGTNSAAVYVGSTSTVTNSGTISTSANNTVGVALGNGSTLTNAAGGRIATTGTNGNGVVFVGSGTLTNAGTISTQAANGTGVTATGNLALTNTGSITATAGRAVDAGTATIFNRAGATISGGTDAIRLNGGTITNQGTVTGANGIVGGNATEVVYNLGTLTGTTGAASLGAGDDAFVKINGATETGNVDGGLGNDTFAYIITDTTNRTFNLDRLGTQYLNFETARFGSQTFDYVNLTTVGAPTATGVVTLSGTTGQAIGIVNTGILSGRVNNTVSLFQGLNTGIAPVFTVTGTGVINAAGNGISATNSGWTINNAGSITAGGIGINAINMSNTTVTNTGTITNTGANTAGVYVGANSTVTNSGTINSTGASNVAVVALGGSTVTNNATGTISASGANSGGVLIIGNGTVTNAGAIRTTGTPSGTAVLINGNGTLTNSGTIAATNGRGVDIGGASTITNNAGATISSGNSDGVRMNGGGTLTNRGTITGATGVLGGIPNDTVINFGTITGTASGVSLGEGNDTFQQWTGARVNGGINLGGGADSFVLEGAMSSVTGNVDGGAGTDVAILAGILDANNLIGFETLQLGSTLGGTLNDLTITGNRTLTGNINHVGIVNVNLGVDSLTTTGTITLASTGVLNIATPLNAALAGQTVTVFSGTAVTNNGARVNITDDDLLLDYALVLNTGVRVRVTAVNPLATSSDPNLAAFGGAIVGGINAGTLSTTNFNALNVLNAGQFQTAAQDALPGISDGLGREIFETASFSGQALDRHLAGEGSGVWAQFAVRGAQQDALSLSADGYDSDQLIFTIGGDLLVSDGIRLGLSASYADIENQDLRGDTVPTETTQAQSIKLGAYAGISLGDRGFLNAELAYITGQAETARNGFFGLTASEFDFNGFIGRATLGYDLLPDENISLTPSIGVNFSRINFDDAQEVGGLGFLVERGDAEFAELRGGLEFAGKVSGKVSGFLSGTIIRDLEDSTRSFRLSSAQLPTFSAVLPLREVDRFELSAGADVAVSDNINVLVGYTGDFNSGYNAHSGRVSVRIGF